MSFLRGIYFCIFLESLVIVAHYFLKFPIAGCYPRAERTVKSDNHVQRAGMKQIPKITPHFQFYRGTLKCRDHCIQDVSPRSGLELKLAYRASMELRFGLSLLHQRNDNPRHGIPGNIENLPLNAGNLQRFGANAINLSRCA